MAYGSMHASMREEVASLRKKLVALETAEADNEKLRKELNKLRVAALEQKSQMELDFMNQLTGVARENALKLEEMEGRLNESNNVNRALSEKLKDAPTQEAVSMQIESLEAQHRKELAESIDANKAEIERTRLQLSQLMESRDKLLEEFDEAKEILAKKEREIETLKSKQSSSVDETELQTIREQLSKVEAAREQLDKELQETKATLAGKDSEIETLKIQLKVNEESAKATLEETLRELQSLKSTREELVTKLEDAKAKLQCYDDENSDPAASQMGKDIEDLKAQLEEASRKLETREHEVDQVKATSLSKEASLKKRLEEMEQENNELASKMASSAANENSSKSLLERVKALEGEKSTLKNEIHTLESAKNEQGLSLTRLQRDKEALTKKYENESRILKERVNSRDQDILDQREEISRLESQISELSGKLEASEEKSKQLVKENSKLQSSMSGLKKTGQELSVKLESLNRGNVQNNDLQHSEQLPPKRLFDKNRLRDSAAEQAKSNLNEAVKASPEFKLGENKTTQIIRRLEQNLKKEGEAKQVRTASLKSASSSESSDRDTREFQNEIANLKKKLDAERIQTAALRREIADLKPSTTFSQAGSVPGTPTRTKHAVSSDNVTRTPVRGLVQDFEKRISTISNATGKRTEIETETIDGLKRALDFERQQVFELEDELTRQCEINCSLLKEIASLSQETENARSHHAGYYRSAGHLDKRRIDHLTNEIAEAKKELKTSEKDKAAQAEQFQITIEWQKKEIEKLSSDLGTVKSKLAKAEETLIASKQSEALLADEQKEVDRLKLQVRQLETKLSESEQELEESRRGVSLEKKEIQRLQSKIASLDAERLAEKKQIEDQDMKIIELQGELESMKADASRVKQLESELCKLQSMKAEHATRGDEINGLRQLVESLEGNLANSEISKDALVKEKEITKELKETIEKLRADLKASKSNIQDLGAELAKAKQTDEESKAELSSQVQALTRDLQDARQKHADVELNCKLHHVGKIDSLAAQVDSLSLKLQQTAEERNSVEQQRREQESKLGEYSEEIDSLSQKVQQLTEERNEVERQKREQDAKLKKLDTMTSEIDSLSQQLKQVVEERDEAQEQNRIQNERFDSLRAEIDDQIEKFERVRTSGAEEIARLQSQLKTTEKNLQESRTTIEELQKKLKERDHVEETVESLQRENQFSLDSHINKLRKELTATRFSADESEKKLQLLEATVAKKDKESRKILESNEHAMMELRNALSEKEGIIGRLSSEKEQLVLSMKDMTMSRRDEIDELQTELVSMSTRAADQAREVQTLKIQLEDSEYRKEEMDRLRKRVRELSDQLATQVSNNFGDGKLSELQLENSELRQRLRDANLSLKASEEKMRDISIDNKNSKAVQVLRDRNVSLKLEVEKLTQKLQKIAERRRSQDKPRSSTGSEGRTIPSARYSYGSEHSGGESIEGIRFMI